MNAIQLIKEIEELPEDQLSEVLLFLNGPEDSQGLEIAQKRQLEMQMGKVKSLSHGQVFDSARRALKLS